MIYSFSALVTKDDYNGEWERGQGTSSVFLRVMFRRIVCEAHSDKSRLGKKKPRAGSGWGRSVRRLEWGKPRKTFLILFWGHDLLLLPENIHLVKWNASIWELFGQADFEVVQKTTKNKNLKPCIKRFLWEISCQSLPTKIINNGTFHFPMS